MTMSRAAIFVITLNAVHARAPTSRMTSTPTQLSVNGLRGSDLIVPFPATGDFELQWLAPSAASTFELELFLEAPSLSGFSQQLWSSTHVGAPMVRLPSTAQLQPDQTYVWRVRTLASGEGGWSELCPFNTAPLWDEVSWIGGGSQLRTDWPLPAGRTVTRARAYASGLGSFQLHIVRPRDSNPDTRAQSVLGCC